MLANPQSAMIKKLILIAILVLSATMFAQSVEALAPTNEQLIETKIITSTSSTTQVKKSIQDEEQIVKQLSQPTLDESIDQYSQEYNIPRQWLVNLATCESTFGTRWYGDKNNAEGPYQYWERTWNYFEKLSKLDLNKHSTHDQTRLTAWALSKGYGSHWSCNYKTGKVK